MKKIEFSELISDTSGANIICIRIPTNEQMQNWGTTSPFSKAEIGMGGNIVWQGFPGDNLQFYAEGPTPITLYCGELIITDKLFPGKSYECISTEKCIKAVP